MLHQGTGAELSVEHRDNVEGREIGFSIYLENMHQTNLREAVWGTTSIWGRVAIDVHGIGTFAHDLDTVFSDVRESIASECAADSSGTVVHFHDIFLQEISGLLVGTVSHGSVDNR